MDREPVSAYAEPNIPAVFRGVTITADRDTSFTYPHFPYNSYIMVQPRDFKEVFGILSVELDLWKPDVSIELELP